MKNYFDDKNKEYVIEDVFYPRREWLNYLWNDTTVCACDQFGFGTSWSVLNSTIRRKIEGGERNLDIKHGERNVYIKDKNSGEFYSANRNYTRLPFEKHVCHVGLGYQTIESEYNGINTQFTVLCPSNGEATMFLIKIKNESNEEKDLSVVFHTTIELENGGHEAYTEAFFDKELNATYYTADGFNLPHEYTHSYFSTSKPINSYAVCEDDFIGRYGSYIYPDGLKRDKLVSKGSTFQSKYIGAVSFDVKLSANEEWQTVVVCGFGKNRQDVKQQIETFTNEDKFYTELNIQKSKCEESLNVFTAITPDEYFNSMANIWLKRQLSLGKTWGRLYGKGFRDVMQDTAAFVSLDVPFARKRIIEILTHQYEDGNPIRMFEPDMRYPYNDSATWIPATVLSYLYESGDTTIMDEKIPYIKGDSYENAKYDLGFFPYVGTEVKYTVFDHVKRAMDYLYSSRGKRGLVLFRAGDWNDSLNNVGKKGIGESVWTTIATVKAYGEFIKILEYLGRDNLIKEYIEKKEELKANVIKYGYDGDHMIYGYNDYDEKIGAEENEEAKIFLNAQTWAVLAEIFDEEKLNELMDKVESRLKCDYGYVQNAPSYTKGSDKLGRVSYFKKGLIENGGVYNHGVSFKIVADCLLGRGDIAYNTFKMMSYDNPKNPNNGVEPYAVSNMYIGPENEYLSGYAPMSWVTGTAGWVYRFLTEYMCGIRPCKDGLMVKPCFPSQWAGAKVIRIFRGVIYNIEFIKSNVYELIYDEKVVDVLPVGEPGSTHNIICKYKI